MILLVPTHICIYFIHGRRETLSWEDALKLASFLGEQLRNLHLLPYPPINKLNFSHIGQEMDFPCVNGYMEELPYKSDIPAEWEVFIRTLSNKQKNVVSRLKNWYVSHL